MDVTPYIMSSQPYLPMNWYCLSSSPSVASRAALGKRLYKAGRAGGPAASPAFTIAIFEIQYLFFSSSFNKKKFQ